MTAMIYLGGKARPEIYKWINALLPPAGKGLYMEPFAGMLGILINRPKSEVELVNDLNGHIFCFWAAIRDHREEFKELCAVTPWCRRTYDTAYADLQAGRFGGDIVKTGWAVYVCLWQGLLHALGQKGWARMFCHGRRGKVWGIDCVPHIETLYERIARVQLESIDAVELLKWTYKKRDSVIYCDPPYGGDAYNGYQTPPLDREAVTEALLKQSGRVAISGYNDDWDHLGWQKHYKRTTFSKVGVAASDQSSERIECLWTNYRTGVKQALF